MHVCLCLILYKQCIDTGIAQYCDQCLATTQILDSVVMFLLSHNGLHVQAQGHAFEDLLV